MVLRVADFFCGAGGFSEGFRQMGFKIVYGTDQWAPAVETFRKNFPEADVPDPIDVLEINIDDIPDVDVVIGGPPCTFFSSSNKGGNGDVRSGMKLVRRFLRIVEELDPKWWVMENVPRLERTLPKSISQWELGIRNKGKYMEIPHIEVLNSADYGVPQARRRLFSGTYPIPPRTHSEDGGNGRERWEWMEDVIWSLPYPLRKRNSGEIDDPLYPQIRLDASVFSDHRYDNFLTDMEVEEVRRLKTRHRYYGKMSFPDNLKRPARTVMASVSRASRETMVIKERRGSKRGYRIPTIRECASLQSFPITYQFWAPSISQRYKLVGNAVPPIIARAIAREMLIKEGKTPPSTPMIRTTIDEIPEPLPIKAASRNRPKYPLQRYYCDFIGHGANHSSSGCRIDLDNRGNKPKEHPIYGKKKIKHIVEWRCMFYTGYSKNVQDKPIGLEEAMSLINKNNPSTFNRKAKRLIKEILSNNIHKIPDATTCQASISCRVDGIKEGPFSIIKKLTELVDRGFPKDRSSDEIEDGGKISVREEITFTQRDAAKIVLGTLIATIMNESDVWLIENWDRHYRLTDWPEIGKEEIPSEPTAGKRIENIIGDL